MTDASDYNILLHLTTEEAKKEFGEGWFPKVTATERNEIRRKQRMMLQQEELSAKKKGKWNRIKETVGMIRG